MPYVGRDLQRGNYLKLDDISSSFDGSTTTFNLQSGGSAFYPGSAFSIFVSVGGVIQEPESAYTINKNTITFANAPHNVDECFITALGVALGIGVPGHGTVNGSQLAKPFNYDGGLLYLDSTNDRVGVGITAPSYTLDVNGTANFSGNVTVGGTLTYQDVASIDAVGIATFQDDVNFNGTGAGISSSYWDKSANEFKFKDNVKLSFGDDRDLQLSHNNSDSVISHISGATGNLKILSGGAQSIECIKAGAVNIAHNGTTRLATTGTGVNITDNLNVSGIATITGYADIRTGSSINTNATGGSSSGTLHKNTTSGEFAVVSGGTGGNNYLSFYTSASAAPTEKFRIEADGHTQIGLIGLSGGNDHGLTITEPGGTTNVLELATANATGRINLSRNLSSTLNTTSYISWTEPGAQGTGEIRFGTSPSSNSPVDRLFITSTGLVTQKGTWTNTYIGTATTQCGYQAQNLSDTTNTYAALRLTAGSSSPATAQLSSIRTGAGANDFAIQLEASNTAFEALRIKSNGKMGLGTNNPDCLLHVMGTEISGYSTHANTKLCVEHNGNTAIEIVSHENYLGGIYFSDSGTDGVGKIEYYHGTGGDNMRFTTDGDQQLCIHQDGHIVTQSLTAPSFNNDSSGARILEVTGEGSVGQYGSINISGNHNTDGAAIGALRFINRENSNSSSGANANSKSIADIKALVVTSDSNAGDDCGGNLVFATKTEASTNNSERVRIDSIGRVLIGSTALVGDATLQVYTSDKLHPGIKVNSPGANGYTMIADAYSATESQLNLGVSQSGSGVVLSRGVKVSTSSDDAYLSSQAQYSTRPSAFKLDDDGSFVFVNTSTNATTAVDSAVALTERFRIYDSNSNGGVAKFTTPTSGDMLNLQNSSSGGQGLIFGVDTSNGYTYWKNNTTASYDAAFIVGGNEKLRIKSNGRVGIGTDAPADDPLTLYDADNNVGMYFQCPATGNANNNGLRIGRNQTHAFVWNYVNQPLALATQGQERLTILGDGKVGINQTVPTYQLHVNGSFAATTKSFVIDHPTKENHQLRYACLEGPENSVYIRGRSSDPVIELPDYWVGLVHEDSITVNVTPIGNKKVWVESINNNSVTIGSDDSTEYFYTVFAERKDVEKLEVEVEK